MKKISSIILVLIFISSCSIEKRHYRKGYSVNWLTHKHNSNIVKINEPPAKEVIVLASNSNTPIILKNETPEINQPEVVHQKRLRAKYKLNLKLSLPKIFSEQQKKTGSAPQEVWKKTPATAWISLAASILSIVLFAFILYGAGLLLATAAVVTGCIAIFKIRHNKEKYKGRGYAIFGIVIGLGLISFSIFLITYFLIVY
ncbi:MAG: DUF4190 domain-containing protein [Bacteroidia bacterium]